MPGLFQAVQQGAQTHHSVTVQVGGWLVHDDDLGFHGANRSDGNQLFLPAGKREDSPVQQALKVHLATHSLHPLLHHRLLHGNILHAKNDLICGICGKKLAAGVLEHASHHRTKLVNRHFQGVLSIQQIAADKFTRIKLRAQPVEYTGQGGFSASAPAGEDHQFAPPHLQIHMAQLAVSLTAVFIGKGNIFQFNQRTPPLSRSRTVQATASSRARSAASFQQNRMER